MEQSISRKTIASRSGLKLKDYLFYSLGDFGNCFIFAVANSLLNKYYTNCLMFNPLYIIIIFAIARIWDAVNDPIMGRIADRLPPNKHGKYKRWFLYMVLPYAVATILMVVQWGPQSLVDGFNSCWWQYVLAGFTYILFGMCMTSIQIPYGSLASVVTADAHERGKLSIWRGVAGNLGGLPVLAVKALCIGEKSEEAPGGFYWQPMIIGVSVLAVFAITFMLICYFGTKERNISKPAPREKGAFKKAIGRITHNRAMLSICVIAVILACGSMFNGVLSVYVSADFFNMTGFFTTLPDILNIVGIFLTMFIVPILSKKLGKKEATTCGAIFCVAVYIAQLFIYFMPRTESTAPYYLYVVCNFLCGLGSGFFNLLLWGMVADAIDDIHIKTGIREDGTSYSILMFSRKIGQTVAFCGGQGILLGIGYVGSQHLSEGQAAMLWFLSTGIPLVAYAVGTILFIFWFPISKKRLEEIQDAKEILLAKEEREMKRASKKAVKAR
ncbi:MAG: glycoside-pentoside-hexuronide (GPH):cation symporter [Bacilli bacterium]|nr:glycoside-pentoside-hexuronide (GPH):cation symporter [Bacilli bacterium]